MALQNQTRTAGRMFAAFALMCALALPAIFAACMTTRSGSGDNGAVAVLPSAKEPTAAKQPEAPVTTVPAKLAPPPLAPSAWLHCPPAVPLTAEYGGYEGRDFFEIETHWALNEPAAISPGCTALTISNGNAEDGKPADDSAVVRLLASLTKLTRLDVGYCAMTRSGMAAVASLPELRELRAGQMDGMTPSVFEPLISSRSLRSLSLDVRAGQFGEYLKVIARIPRLEALDLMVINDDPQARFFDPLDDATFHSVNTALRAIRNMPTLRVLGLCYQQFGDEAIEAIGGPGGLSNLEALDMVWTRVTGKGVAKLAERYVENGTERTWLPGLRELHVDGGAVDDTGLALLSTLSGLKHLSLVGPAARVEKVRFTNAGFSAIARMKDLTALSLRDCDSTTADAFVRLAAAPKLEEITVYECEKVDSEAVKAIAKLPHLRKLVLADWARQWSDDHYAYHESLDASAIAAFEKSKLEELRLPWGSPLAPELYTERTLRRLQAALPGCQIRSLNGEPFLQYARIAVVTPDGKPWEDATVVIVDEATGKVAAIATEQVISGLHLKEYVGPPIEPVESRPHWLSEKTQQEVTTYDSGSLPVGRYRVLVIADGAQVAESPLEVTADQRTDVTVKPPMATTVLWEHRHGEPIGFRSGPGPTPAEERRWNYWLEGPADSLYRVGFRPWDAFNAYYHWTTAVCSAAEGGIGLCRYWGSSVQHDSKQDGSPDDDIGMTFDRTPVPGTYYVRVFVIGHKPQSVPFTVTGDPVKDSVPVILNLE